MKIIEKMPDYLPKYDKRLQRGKWIQLADGKPRAIGPDEYNKEYTSNMLQNIRKTAKNLGMEVDLRKDPNGIIYVQFVPKQE